MFPLLRDLDGVLRTVRLSEAGGLLKLGWHGSVADDDALAEVVRVEDLRGATEAASVGSCRVFGML